jgi:D-tyrosyl-tRNA(Tyr) deacylase
VVLQRVSDAAVHVGDECIARIGEGIVVLVGVGGGDTQATAEHLARRCVAMRIFAGGSGSERSVADIGGSVLVVSQFTLLADTRRGNRPSWSAAATAADAEPIVTAFADAVAALGVPVARGRFGAHMRVSLTNDGPVTIVVEETG